MRTFGEELKHFSLSVDIIEQGKFDETFRIVEEYLKKRIHISKLCLLEQGFVDGRTCLHPRYGNVDLTRYGSYSIKDENGNISSLTAFAYDFGKPIWVIPEDEKSDLHNSDKYIELLAHVDANSLPKYRKVYEGTCRTLISIPLIHQGKSPGILFFESERIIKPTKALRYELENVSSALGILFLLLEADNLRRNNTKEALYNLKQVPQTSTFHSSLFLAYSKNADKKVINIIRRILSSKYSNITIIDWDKMNRGGESIVENIIEGIYESQYGIFYLSELDQQTNQYKDNPNVLFEAGMMYSLIKQNYTTHKRWIPIRERESSSIPFDFAGDQILFVARDNKILNEEIFSQDLEEMLENTIDHDQP